MDAFIKKTLLVCIAIVLSLTSANAVELDKSYKNLVLNGEGVRDKFFIDLYVGGLYLEEKSTNAKEILESKKSMNIRLHIVSSLITSKKMEDATREGFEKSTNGNIGPIKEDIELFISVFKEEIKENDVYDIFYSSATGVQVYKNQKLKTTIVGLEFKKALFGIWIGKNPAQNSLKEDMLGN